MLVGVSYKYDGQKRRINLIRRRIMCLNHVRKRGGENSMVRIAATEINDNCG